MRAVKDAQTVLLTTDNKIQDANATFTAFLFRFKKQELNSAICKLERIRKNIDYIISCNGDFTEKEFKEIVANC